MKSIYDKNEWDIRVTLAEVHSGTWNGNLGRDRRIVLKLISWKHVTRPRSAYSWLTIGFVADICKLNNKSWRSIKGCEYNGLQNSC
jgi:hypothetical protein